MEHVSQTNHASKNMIMKTVTSLHDVGCEESWALLDDQKWKMVIVLNATVYGVMKRCLKKKVHCRQVSWNHCEPRHIPHERREYVY